MAYYPRRKAQIFFTSHRDCFVHGTNDWKSWLVPSRDQLFVVKLIFSDGRQIFSTLSLKPALPSGISKRGLRKDQYLEIDPVLAKAFGIMEGDEVVVESAGHSEVARKITVTLDNTNDQEVLMLNQEKMEHDILDQIRVVSVGYPFPIWINNQPIILKLVSSEPVAKWVLIVKDTYVEFQPPSSGTGSTLSTPTSTLQSPFPERAPSSESSHSDFSEILSTVSQPLPKRHTYHHPAYPQHRRHSSQTSFICLPSEEDSGTPGGDSLASSQDEAYSIMATLPQMMQNFLGSFLRRSEQNPEAEVVKEERRSLDTETRKRDKLPFPPATSPSKTYYGGMKVQHGRQLSWHSSTQKEVAERKHLPLYVLTPEFDAPLRIQALPIGEDLPWSSSHCFDVFVHPLSLPDLYQASVANQTPGQKEPSCLVQLSVEGCTGSVGSGGQANGKGDTGTKNDGKVGSPNSERRDMPTLSEGKAEEKEQDILVQVMTGLWREFTGKAQSTTAMSSGARAPLQQPSPLPTQCRVAVARLIFATYIQFGRRSKRSSSLEEAVSRENSYTSSPEASSPPALGVAIIPGHILMSDLLRQQLGLKVNSVVKMLHVKEQWRILPSFYKISIGLTPLTNTHVDIMHLKRGFKQWVRNCQSSNPFGCVFCDNMVLPLPQTRSNTPDSPPCHSSELVLCRVTLQTELAYREGGRQRERSSPEPPLRFLQLSLSDLESKDKRRVPVNVTVNPSQGGEGGGGEGGGDGEAHSDAGGLPNLKELGPMELSISADQFGAMNHYVEEGMYHVAMAISCRVGRALLICSSGGGTGGCGKTSLAKLLCRNATEQPLSAHPIITNCTLLRGKRVESLRKKLMEVREEALLHQPAVVVLDDLDQLAEQVSDIQKEVSGEGVVNTRAAQVILEFLTEFRKEQIAVVVIATAESKATVHPLLLQSRGIHVFDKIIEISPPTLTERQEILEAILRARRSQVSSVLSTAELRSVALRTEGYQAGDLVALVNRAVSLAAQEAIRSRAAPLRSSPRHPFFGHTPAKKDSVATVVASQLPQRELGPHIISISASCLHQALEGFIPSSLRGLSLHSSSRVDFSHVGGLAAAKTTLRETLQWPSKYPRLFKQCPIRQHAGILLYGAPGTGKTLLAGAVAREFGLNFVSINGPELLNKYIGASEQAVRDLFARAQAARPCILFFDEFDSLAPQRGHDRTGVTDRVVNQLLTQLDGVEMLEGVYVLAATSRPDLIDPALLRPGRIDKTLFCDLPSQEEREEVLEALGRTLPLAEGVSLSSIAAQTEHFTGADLKALLYNAQLLAANQALQTSQTGLSSLSGNIKVESKLETTSGASEGEDDSGFHGNPNSVTSSVSSSTSDRTRIGSQKTDSHSTSSHPYSKPRDPVGEEGLWEFHMSGEMVKQETSQLSKEVERLIKAPGDQQGSKEEQRHVLKCEITTEHLQTALKDTKPSLSPAERERYNKIFSKFSGHSPVTVVDYREQRVTLA